MKKTARFFAALLALASTQSFATIGFEKTSGVGNPSAHNYTENDYTFNSWFETRLIGSPTLCPFGGCVASTTGQYIGVIGIDQEKWIRMWTNGGSSFDLFSFDAAELYLNDSAASLGNSPNATIVNVIGHKRDDSGRPHYVSASFDLDGIKDGAGGMNDFQTFFLPDSFRDLYEATFSGYIPNPSGGGGNYKVAVFALDNIGTPAFVPEPSTWALFLLGLTSLWYFRKRSTKA